MNHRWEYARKCWRDGTEGPDWKEERKELDRKLALKGADGWELVTAYPAGEHAGLSTFIFKRRIAISRQVVYPR